MLHLNLVEIEGTILDLEPEEQIR